MSSDPVPRRSLFAVWHWPRWTWGVVALLMLVAYPLSIGPVRWFMDNAYYVPKPVALAINIFYIPLGLAIQNSELVESVMLWYLRLWTPD